MSLFGRTITMPRFIRMARGTHGMSEDDNAHKTSRLLFGHTSRNNNIKRRCRRKTLEVVQASTIQ